MVENRSATPRNILFVNRPKPQIIAPAFISALIAIQKGKQNQRPLVITIPIEWQVAASRQPANAKSHKDTPQTANHTRMIITQVKSLFTLKKKGSYMAFAQISGSLCNAGPIGLQFVIFQKIADDHAFVVAFHRSNRN